MDDLSDGARSRGEQHPALRTRAAQSVTVMFAAAPLSTMTGMADADISPGHKDAWTGTFVSAMEESLVYISDGLISERDFSERLFVGSEHGARGAGQLFVVRIDPNVHPELLDSLISDTTLAVFLPPFGTPQPAQYGGQRAKLYMTRLPVIGHERWLMSGAAGSSSFPGATPDLLRHNMGVGGQMAVFSGSLAYITAVGRVAAADGRSLTANRFHIDALTVGPGGVVELPACIIWSTADPLSGISLTNEFYCHRVTAVRGMRTITHAHDTWPPVSWQKVPVTAIASVGTDVMTMQALVQMPRSAVLARVGSRLMATQAVGHQRDGASSAGRGRQAGRGVGTSGRGGRGAGALGQMAANKRPRSAFLEQAMRNNQAIAAAAAALAAAATAAAAPGATNNPNLE
jgi:hypothetical protein